MTESEQDYQKIQSPDVVDLHHRRFKKFQLDLQFVQLLGDPGYVIYLVQSGYLRQKQFICYLKYLSYFNKPEYLIYIRYPEGLKYLQLLQQADFVRFIEDSGKNEYGITPFGRILKLQGFLHSKHMWAQREA